MTKRSKIFIAIVGLITLAVYCLFHFQINSSIAHFIPDRSEAKLIQISLDLIDSPLSRNMVLSIHGSDQRKQLTEELSERLREHPEVAWIDTDLINENSVREFYELYFDRRIYFVSTEPERAVPRLLESGSLQRRAQELKALLYAPDAAIHARTAHSDPLGLFPKLLKRIRNFQSPAHETSESDYNLIFVGLRSSPFDSSTQRDLIEYIEDQFELLNAQQELPMLMEKSGANLFSIAAEKTIRNDVNLISVLSVVAVGSVFLVFFGSVRSLAIALMAPIAGFLVALAIALSRSDQVHGITLAFGFILIGVAIDYPIHVMSHYKINRGIQSAFQSVRRLAPSLVMSAATTTLAFLSLSISGFPGLGAMGTFAAIGIPASLLFTLYLLPAFIAGRPARNGMQRIIDINSRWLIDQLNRKQPLPLAILAIMLIVSVVGITSSNWQDDPADLMNMDPVILEESGRVQDRSGAFDQGRIVIALANDSESALILNEKVAERLEPLIQDGSLSGIGSLRTLLPSTSLQRRNLEAFQSDSGYEKRVNESFAAEGFETDAFSTFFSTVHSPGKPPLKPADLVETKLQKILSLLPPIEGGRAAITLLRGVEKPERIQNAIQDLNSVYYIDQKAIISGIYQGYRESTLLMILIGSGIVLGVLLLRYRNGLRALMACLPAFMGIGVTLGILSLLGLPTNVASTVSLLVVLGMGADYGIFAVDSAGDSSLESATISSLIVSCLSSVFVFGVLALSSQPILQTIGLTTGIGVFVALCTAPISMAMTRERQKLGQIGLVSILGVLLISVLGCQNIPITLAASPCSTFIAPSESVENQPEIRSRFHVRFKENLIGFEVIAHKEKDEWVIAGISEYGTRIFTVTQRQLEIEIMTKNPRMKALARCVVDILNRSLWLTAPKHFDIEDRKERLTNGEFFEDVFIGGMKQRLFFESEAKASAPGVIIKYLKSDQNGSGRVIDIENKWCGYEASVLIYANQ